MNGYEALVIGGSAGSLEVLLKVLPDLPHDLSFPILIVIHRKHGNDPLLADLLRSRTSLQVKEAEEKETIQRGTIYIAPSDYHLLIERDHTFSLDYSEKINYSRPSIDVTFQSAAEIYGEQLACILLSGSNADGVEGLKAVKHFGGRAIAQDPQSASVSFMPEQAILHVAIDAVLTPEKMAEYIRSLMIKVS